MAKKIERQYIIRKYVIARDVKEALKKEKDIPADEAWIDEQWKSDNPCLVEVFKTNKLK